MSCLFEEYTSPRTRQVVVDGICRFLGTANCASTSRASRPRFTRRGFHARSAWSYSLTRSGCVSNSRILSSRQA